MNTMPELHQTSSPWSWRLAPRQSTTLAAAPVPRWLHVQAGRVWATSVSLAPQAEDHWLQAGESLELPPGSEWVLEGGPQAQLALLEAPAKAVAASGYGGAARPSRLLRSASRRPWWQALQLSALPCSSCPAP